MNDDRSRLYDDARHSDSNLMRLARERAEVTYCKARWDSRSRRDPLDA